MMEKSTYSNPLAAQCLSLPEMCAAQLQGVLQGLQQAVPAAVLKTIRRVILTGCGDSYLAAQAAVPAFRHYSPPASLDCTVMRCIEVARNLTLAPAEAGATLVVGISASGGALRVEEALKRAKGLGAVTLAVTNNPASIAAKAAAHVLAVNTPSFPTAGPGMRSYYASLLALQVLAAQLAEALHTAPAGSAGRLADAVRTYTARFGQALAGIDQQMFELATAWKGFKGFEMIGDHADAATAGFIAAKFAEAAGTMCVCADSEDWCHVNYFHGQPEVIGTLVICRKNGPNLSRIHETLYQAQAVKRPILLITDADEPFTLSPQSVLCRLPSPPDGSPAGDSAGSDATVGSPAGAAHQAGYDFLQPLLNHLPGALLASYYAALNHETYFRGAV